MKHFGHAWFASLVWMSAVAGMPMAAAEDPAKSTDETDPETLMAEWETKLEGSEWKIQLSPAAGPGTPQSDSLTLQGGTLGSQWLSKEGFTASNYTLKPQGAAAAELQTNQSNPDGHVASWRVTVRGESISGAVNKRTPDGQAVVYYVSGTKVAGAPPPSEASPASHREPDSARGESSRGTTAAGAPATPPPAQQPVAQQPKLQTSQPPAPAPAPASEQKKKWGWW